MIQAMVAHPTAWAVQANACAALRNLCIKPEHKLKVAALGGCVAVFHALRRCVSVTAPVEDGGGDVRGVGVVQAACGALWNLASLEGIREGLLEIGVVDEILRAMASHPSQCGVQENGLGLLRILAQHPAHKVRIAEPGGVALVLRALASPAGRTQALAENCCRLVAQLSWGSATVQLRVAAMEGCMALVSTMGAHGSSAAVQEYGCAALRNLASDLDWVRTKAVDTGACGVVLAALNRHHAHVAVLLAACAAVRALAISPAARSNMVQAEAIDVVVRAMGAH